MNILFKHMQQDFNILALLIQEVHAGAKVLEGQVSVRRGGLIANIICSVFGFPRESEGSHLTVSCTHTPDKIVWVRDFDGLKMPSTFYSKGQYLVERLGLLDMSFVAKSKGGSLVYEFSRIKFLGIPLPPFLRPKITAYEQEVEDRYEFL